MAMSRSKKYPIGTRIKFINPVDNDGGKLGFIVDYRDSGGPTIYLPTATKHIKRNYNPTLSDGTKFSWHCQWKDIEILSQKNKQLLFDFMYEVT